MGNIYWVEGTTGTVTKMFVNGTKLTVGSGLCTGSNYGIAADSSGNFYVSSGCDSKIYKGTRRFTMKISYEQF